MTANSEDIGEPLARLLEPGETKTGNGSGNEVAERHHLQVGRLVPEQQPPGLLDDRGQRVAVHDRAKFFRYGVCRVKNR